MSAEGREQMSATPYAQIAGRSVERLSALSDGVFSIAMTLLILEAHVPHLPATASERDLWLALVGLAPQIAMYLVGFMTRGIFWVGQQAQLTQFERVDKDLTWIHIAFLACVALMPFSTALLGRFITFRLALVIYWLNILLLGLWLLGSWTYARRGGLLKEEATAAVDATTRRRIISYQAAYAGCVALCVINTYWSIGLLMLLQVNAAVSGRTRLMRVLGARSG